MIVDRHGNPINLQAQRREVVTVNPFDALRGPLSVLADPDPVLRKLGVASEVYDAIEYDSHVLGELRAIRAGVLSYEHRWKAGGTSAQAIAALELVQRWWSNHPAPMTRWPDLIWGAAQSVFRGWAAFQHPWKRFDRTLVPEWVRAVPESRFRLTNQEEPRLLTMGAPLEGEAIEALEFSFIRHMPSTRRPYGIAVFSACVVPMAAKSNGWDWFQQLCKRNGIPWSIATYPAGTADGVIDEIVEGLAAMILNGVAAIPEGGDVKLLEYSGSGDPLSMQLIDLANREMSKALTSQTNGTDPRGTGTYGGQKAGLERAEDGYETEREQFAWWADEMARNITTVNFGPDVESPIFEFFSEAKARKEWAEVFEIGRNFMEIPTAFAHDRMEIPQPQNGEAVLPAGGVSEQKIQKPASEDFSAPHGASCGCGCGGAVDFSAGAADSSDAADQFAARLAEQAQPHITRLVDLARAEAAQASSMDDLLERLIDLHKRVVGGGADREYGALIEDALVASHSAGRYDLLQEAQ